MTAPENRPAALTAAFWSLLVGAVLLIVGGLTTATVSFAMLRQAAPPSYSDETLRDSLTVYRGTGIVVALAGAGLAWLVARTRRADVRARRATLGLALAIVVLIAVAAALHLAPVSIFVVVAVLPVIVGIVALTRPAVAEWFAAGIPPVPAADPPSEPDV